MSGYHSGGLPAGRGVTLHDLREQLYSLNMRMLLAMQNHDERAQAEIRDQTAAIQEEIDRLCLGGRHCGRR